MLIFFFHTSFTRYSERVLINHKRTRSLLKQFAMSGVTIEEVKELTDLVALKATFLSSLLRYLFHNSETASEKVRCPEGWVEFITALASSSPVCALIHPDHELHQVVRHIANGFSDFDTGTLHYLQENCPVILNLLQKVKKLPQKQIFSVFNELLERSNAPFIGTSTPLEQKALNRDLGAYDFDDGYFPALPICRHRQCYSADTITASKICTKRGTSHPTLLPGIFTLFCSHGILLYFKLGMILLSLPCDTTSSMIVALYLFIIQAFAMGFN